MAIRNIACMGNPILRKKAEPIPEKEILSIEVQALLKDMVETMFEYDGRGLAAPQIHESVQALVMTWDFDNEKDPHLVFLINPKIDALNNEKTGNWEGCLSVPGLRGYVERPNKISVSAYNEKGKKVEFIAEGFAATVIQHECDHLWGKLYVDHIEDKTKLAFNKEYARYHISKDDEQNEE